MNPQLWARFRHAPTFAAKESRFGSLIEKGLSEASSSRRRCGITYMSENAIIAPNMEHAYWGVKCKNPECQHYILREDLSLQPEGIVGIPPEPYPNFDQTCEHCGQIHMYARNDVQVVQGAAPAAAAETQLRAAQAHERQLKASA